jgi:hypothetical protein
MGGLVAQFGEAALENDGGGRAHAPEGSGRSIGGLDGRLERN